MGKQNELRVVEVFATMQGEGGQVGEPSVFVRLAGCNLWSGKEATRARARGGCGMWCDTVFTGGAKYTVEALLAEVGKLCTGWASPLVVLTGGEPMLQLSMSAGKQMVGALVGAGYRVAVETNGTIPVDFGTMPVHVTVSPKPLADDPSCLDHVVQQQGQTLKVVWPTPLPLEALSAWDFDGRYLQPMDTGNGPPTGIEMQQCLEAAARLGWRVSVQTHKLVHLP